MNTISAMAAAEALRRHYNDVVVNVVNNKSDLDELLDRKPDLVFLGMHYLPSEIENEGEVWLSDILSEHNICHTGSGKSAHRLAVNKQLAKQRMIETGLNTSPFQIIRRNNEEVVNEGNLHFPLFVKPSNQGGGRGIDEFSVTHTVEELNSKIASIHETEDADALVEEFLDGREFSVAVIADPLSGELIAMPLELVATEDANGERMLSKAVKRSNAEVVLEVTDADEKLRLQDFAIDAFQALGARDYGRIDIRFDSHDTPHFLEANLIPSLIDGYGSFPKAYRLHLGGDHEAMIVQIVELALQSNPSEGRLVRELTA